MDDWSKCGGSIDEAELIGRPCYAGLDLSKTTDLSSLALVFPPVEKGEKWKAIAEFWIPRERVEKLKGQDGAPYPDWIRDGWLTSTPGDVIDYDFITSKIVDLSQKYQIEQIAYDPWNCTQTALQMQEEGIEMVEHRQGVVSMNEPTKEFLRAVIKGDLCHGDNPILTWMASNLQTKEDAGGNIKPDKGASTQKIDGIVALIMAYGRAILNEDQAALIDAESVFFV